MVTQTTTDVRAPERGSRRPGLWLSIVIPVGVVALLVAARHFVFDNHADIPLHSEAVAVSGDGERVLIPAGEVANLIPGSRAVGDSPESAAVAREQIAWLESGVVPEVEPEFDEMIRTALLDIHVLTAPAGGVVAGWSDHWRYVWPRDASFAAAALARTAHLDDALRVLTFLQDVQESDGRFHARYLPDGSGVPDDRGIQLDGTGWVLWATRELAMATPAPDRAQTLETLRPMINRAASAALRAIDTPDSLPPPSRDYWEVPEDVVTLGTAAPLLAGLYAAAELHAALGDGVRSHAAREGAERLAVAVHSEFGVDGYLRHLGRSERDAAVAFLLPPFTPGAAPDVLEALSAAEDELRRPAGGLAPGAGWKDDGVSWTPETALFALVTAAVGDREQAMSWLSWLDEHRTAAGALPEKVLADGRPASAAPLSWTAALVVLTATELDRRDEAAS